MNALTTHLKSRFNTDPAPHSAKPVPKPAPPQTVAGPSAAPTSSSSSPGTPQGATPQTTAPPTTAAHTITSTTIGEEPVDEEMDNMGPYDCPGDECPGDPMDGCEPDAEGDSTMLDTSGWTNIDFLRYWLHSWSNRTVEDVFGQLRRQPVTVDERFFCWICANRNNLELISEQCMLFPMETSRLLALLQ